MQHHTDYDVLYENMKKAVMSEIRRSGMASISEFCKKTGIPRTTLRDCLSGRRETSLRIIVSIANALGIPVIKLLNFPRAENYVGSTETTEKTI